MKGEAVMLGYYKDPEGTAAVLRDGWFHTGDLARMDADGYIYLTGRKNNLMILPSRGERQPRRAGSPPQPEPPPCGKCWWNSGRAKSAPGFPAGKGCRTRCGPLWPGPTAPSPSTSGLPQWSSHGSPLPRNALGKLVRG